jgi:small-conductance mechanosensitive channel
MVQFILNIRRSGQMSETFPFDVAYDTTFEQLEQLRDQMVAFLESERRDFLPSFDLSVMGASPGVLRRAGVKSKR